MLQLHGRVDVKKAAKLFIARRLAGRPVAPLLFLLATALALSSCSAQGAPSFMLFGAYFPAWMFCAAIGLVAAIVARAFFEATGLAYVLPYQLFVCVSIGVCAALAAQFVWFGP